MVHKTSSTPTSGADAAGIYGADYNKLVNHLTRATAITDPFTFNFDEHTFKDSTTNTLGDLLMNNGTKFGRRAKGSALQYLRVNSGGTDLEWATLGAGGDVTGAANVGSGGGQVFRDEVAGVLNLKTLLAGTNISLTNNANDVTISATGGAGGEANLGANVGTGTGTLFRDKTSVTLNFKTLLAGSNITLTNNANDVTIASTAGGGDVTGAANVGSGAGQVFRDEVTGVLNLKTILAGTNMTVTNNANDITLAATGGSGEVNTASNVNLTGTGPAVGIFKQKTAVNLEFRGIDVVSTSRLSVALDATNNTIDLDIPNGAIADAQVSASAAIAKSKLAALAITNTDLSGSAGITDANLAQITNKTKLPEQLWYDWSQVKHANLTLTTATGAEGIWQGCIASTGTFTNLATTSTNWREKWETAATTNAQAGIRTTILWCKGTYTNPTHGYALHGKFDLTVSLAQYRAFFGLTAGFTGAFPTAGQEIATWGNNQNMVGIWISETTTGATNIKRAHNDTTGAPTVADISPTSTVAGGGTKEFMITYDEATPAWNINFEGTDNILTTDIPVGNSGSMGLLFYIETKENVLKGVELRYLQACLEPR